MMDSTQYKSLDLSNLIFKDEPTPSEIALQDVEPFQWSQEVMDGKRKVSVSTTIIERV